MLIVRSVGLALAIYLVLGASAVDLREPCATRSNIYSSAPMGLAGRRILSGGSNHRSPSHSRHGPGRQGRQHFPGHRPRVRARALSAQTKPASSGPNLLLLVDSGASFHIHNNYADLINVRPCVDVFEGVDRVRHHATCMGDLDVQCHDSNGKRVGLKISDVRIFPKVSDSLISVSQLWTKHKVQVQFSPTNAIMLKDENGAPAMSLPIVPRNGIFEWRVQATARLQDTKSRQFAKYCPRVLFGNKSSIRSTKSHSYFNEYSADVAAHHMHLRLHAGTSRLRSLPSITADAPPSLSRAGPVRCEHCAIANSTLHPHTATRYQPSYAGRLIHADIAGEFSRTRVGQNKWVLVLVDDHTRFKFAFPIRNRSDAPAQLRKFVASFNLMARNAQHQGRLVRTIGSLLNDKAGEFISKDFRDFLAGNLVQQTTSPAEVHSLNGVAERAIRSIMEQSRSMMVASNAPLGFWDFAVLQAVDILNRTTCPPNSEHSCYEMLSGERPRILSILPFGCRMYAARAKQGNHKSTHYPRAYEGINLGRSIESQGAYCVWVPNENKVVTTSEVYHDETLMPWRPVESQRIADPAPIPADGDSEQPVTIPIGADPGAPAPPLNTLSAEFQRLASSHQSEAVPGRETPASLSRHVLVLFSGPKDRPDGLMTFLRRLGFSITAVDNDPKNGGGQDDDILRDVVYDKLLRSAQRGEFFAVIAAPPCSTFSVARLIRSSQSPDGGPPPVRSRTQIQGMSGIPATHRRELSKANTIIVRTVSILNAAAESGAEFIIENPADRGDPSNEELFIHEDHGPLWLLPEILGLEQTWSCRKVTFPQCAFGASVLKHTTLMYTPSLEKTLGDFGRLKCTHTSHTDRAGGNRRADGTWNSADMAAYPANMNLALAQCIAVAAGAQKDAFNLPLPAGPDNSTSDPPAFPESTSSPRITQQRSDIWNRGGSHTTPNAAPTFMASEPSSAIQNRVCEMGEAESELSLSHDDVDTRVTNLPEDSMPETNHEDGPISSRLRSRSAQGRVLVASKHTLGRMLIAVGHNLSLAVEATDSSPTLSDPKNRREAMAAPDKEGWIKAEEGELGNHKRNGSFEIISQTQFRSTARGRKLVRLTWAYKRKRSGALKARLCVQGCSQIPGVDYDQTFCGAMRSTSLRMLAALSTQLNLLMRRFDFVSAFLQGSLEEGEVIFCACPPGYEETGSDGLPQVYKVLKPVYGMAQAGRRWQRTLFPWLLNAGPKGGNLSQSESDPSVFFSRCEVKTPNGSRKETLIVGVYVDDLFILYSHSDSHSLYHRFISALCRRWDVEDEGMVSDLLNVEISRSASGHVTLRQTAYIDKLVATHAPQGVPKTNQRNKTPCDPSLPQSVLEAVDSDEDPNPEIRTKYMSLVGALLYCATHTRPDIAYSVGLLSRAMARPNPVLYEAALRVLYYLYRTRMLGLRYSPEDTSGFHGMSDSDWAVRHSTSGSVFMLAGAAVSWSSKRQVTIALSSCEAEIMAASEAAKETIYLSTFLKELGMFPEDKPAQLAVDNSAARDLAYNPQHHDRTKHIARRHFFIREMVEDGRLSVPYVRTTDNLADFFTKPLPASVFFAMRDKIMNIKEDFPSLLESVPDS